MTMGMVGSGIRVVCSVPVSEGQQRKGWEYEGCGKGKEGNVGWSGEKRQSFHTDRGRIEMKKVILRSRTELEPDLGQQDT